MVNMFIKFIINIVSEKKNDRPVYPGKPLFLQGNRRKERNVVASELDATEKVVFLFNPCSEHHIHPVGIGQVIDACHPENIQRLCGSESIAGPYPVFCIQ